jgi:prophage DNA circulation protein
MHWSPKGVTLREELQTSLASLVNTTQYDDITTDLAPAVYAAYTALMNCCAAPDDQITFMEILSRLQPPSTVTANGDAVDSEITALAARTAVLIWVAALINLGLAIAAYNPTSSTDAMTLRNTVAGLMDAEMTQLASWYDDTDYYALAARVAVVTDLNARGNLLSPVVDMTSSSNLPWLVLAQQWQCVGGTWSRGEEQCGFTGVHAVDGRGVGTGSTCSVRTERLTRNRHLL